MKYSVYKILFYVFNFLGILNLRFDGNRFKFFKVLYCKTLIFFVIVITNFFLDNYSPFKNYNKASISLFSKIYLLVSEQSQIFIITIIVWIHLHRQKEIADIFTIFHNLKKICDEKKLKINLRRLKFKLTLFLVLIFLYFIVNLANLFVHEPNFKWSEVMNNFLQAYLVMFFFSLFAFIYFILVLYEIILKNLNEILENQMNVIHNNCEELLNNLILIHQLFKLLKESFQTIILLYTIFQLGIISRIVNLIFNHLTFIKIY